MAAAAAAVAMSKERLHKRQTERMFGEGMMCAVQVALLQVVPFTFNLLLTRPLSIVAWLSLFCTLSLCRYLSFFPSFFLSSSSLKIKNYKVNI